MGWSGELEFEWATATNHVIQPSVKRCGTRLEQLGESGQDENATGEVFSHLHHGRMYNHILAAQQRALLQEIRQDLEGLLLSVLELGIYYSGRFRRFQLPLVTPTVFLDSV